MDKIYKLDGVDFRLKDLTMNEVKKFNTLFKLSGDTIELPDGKTQKFFSMILIPADTGVEATIVANKLYAALLRITSKIFRRDKKIIYPGDCSDRMLAEVTRDFFSERIKNELDLRNSFMSLTEKLKKPAAPTKQ